jgi:hypothetical protein
MHQQYISVPLDLSTWLLSEQEHATFYL